MSSSAENPSSSKDMGLDEKKEPDTSKKNQDSGGDEKYDRQMSEVSIGAVEDEEEEDGKGIVLGPQCTLKEHMEKDKDDESLTRWKEQLLGSVDLNAVGAASIEIFKLVLVFGFSDVAPMHPPTEKLEAEVTILGISIISPGRPELILRVPQETNPKGLWFTLKEGSRYSLKFSFLVSHNIVSGLRYTNTVWKTGVKVDSTRQMLGTFSPQSEPYEHEMEEETTPSGMFARGTYSARTKFIDDDDNCYFELNYTFDIKKEWAPIS
ncbi:Rab GDP dissociation inhibitor alpha [Asimina triloba]